MSPNFQNLIISRKGRFGLFLVKIQKTRWPPAAILKVSFPDEILEVMHLVTATDHVKTVFCTVTRRKVSEFDWFHPVVGRSVCRSVCLSHKIGFQTISRKLIDLMSPNFQNIIFGGKGRLGLILSEIGKTRWRPDTISVIPVSARKLQRRSIYFHKTFRIALSGQKLAWD